MTDNKDIREKLNEEAAGEKSVQSVPVYAEIAEAAEVEVSPEELKALALAYAKYLAENGMEPGEPTFTDSEPEAALKPEPEIGQAAEPAELAEETAAEETTAEESTAEEAATVEESVGEAESVSETVAAPEADSKTAKEAKEAKASKKGSKQKKSKSKAKTGSEESGKAKAGGSRKRKVFLTAEPSEAELQKIEASLAKADGRSGVGSLLDVHDKVQMGFDDVASGVARDFITAIHQITSTYRQSRRVIGLALLIIGVMAGLILAIFDKYTVYEYSYNGKALGYVSNQEEVTDVLDIAGTMLTENSSGDAEIRFVANENVTFNPVDARGKSTDDADTAVNKLVYMTDIETEAYGVYDGGKLVAVVKSNEDAEDLLEQTRAYLSEPDEGMKLISSEFTNGLDIRPINVLLTSVQSNKAAMKQMTEGGKMDVYHIVEEGETLEDIERTYGVDETGIFNEENESVTEVAQGDSICLHILVDPVRVMMVEKGRMKEIVEFKTVKKESDDYYKGDTYTEQEGVNGVQIFEGTVTKIAGEVSNRKTDNIEVIRKKKDKIILIGTAERPKTAPTGTYAMPIQHYTFSSGFGYRWGRLHSGVDLAAPTGTPIYASDGGTVQRAGWYAGYGLCVEIDHENGRMTRYGHCSRLLVNVGDKVYQGQNIALVGNTGHSFGSHLHFEININGSPTNPVPYLGI